MDFSLPGADLVIFDCDGVLVDSEMLSCQCLSEALGAHGVGLGVEQVLQLFLGRSTAASEGARTNVASPHDAMTSQIVENAGHGELVETGDAMTKRRTYLVQIRRWLLPNGL